MLEELPKPYELRGTVKGTLLYLGLYVVLEVFQSFCGHALMAQKKKEMKDQQSKLPKTGKEH